MAGLQAAASADGRRSVFLYTVQPQVAPLSPVVCCAVTGVSPGRSGQSCQRFLQCVLHCALHNNHGLSTGCSCCHCGCGASL